MRVMLFLLLLITTIVDARMYQWTEPDTGTTQLSGKPPAWYRSDKGGPRVFVFDNGRLIDDTAVEVTDDVRLGIRQQAFILAEEDRQKAQEKIAKSEELKQKYRKTELDELEQSSDDGLTEEDSTAELITDGQFSDDYMGDDQEKDSSIADKTLDELREMIIDWEKSQTESAKKALE